MAVSFPSTDVESRVIVTGPAKVYIADQTTNGSDATLTTDNYLGATDGGTEIHIAYTKHHIMVDQCVNEVESVPVKEEYTIKTRIVQLNLYNLYMMLQTPDMTAPTGGKFADASSSMLFGEQLKGKYFQLLLRTTAPPGATNRERVYQFWKATVHATGPIKLEKPKESGLEVTWKALTDLGAKAAGKGAVLKVYDA